ncbi:hypothetical protein ACFSRY_18725 [Pontibacter locisalis]|uniref:Uncharacterized protein n=1 Tax=Pontibacter locisalis TaxID=1719035 RepID=A0ABW5ISH2_9BACT
MLTTTAERSAAAPEKESLQVQRPKQIPSTAKQKSQFFGLCLKTLYLYASVLGVVLVLCGLLIAVKNHNVLMVECFKALMIVGILNLIRVFSIS